MSLKVIGLILMVGMIIKANWAKSTLDSRSPKDFRMKSGIEIPVENASNTLINLTMLFTSFAFFFANS